MTHDPRRHAGRRGLVLPARVLATTPSSLLAVLLIVAPFLLSAFYIAAFAVDVPVADEISLFHDIRAVHDETQSLSSLWRQHNEHRIPVPRLALLLLASLSAWNTIVEMYVNLALLIVLLPIWWALYRQVHPAGPWAFVPLAWLLGSLGQWENLLNGWQLSFCLGVLAMCVAIYLIARPTWPRLSAAGLAAVVASLSFINGLVVWPVGFLALAAARAPAAHLATWGVAGAALIAAYAVGYVTPSHHPSPREALAHPLETLHFLLATVGAPLARGSSAWATAAGACIILLLGLLLRHDLPRLRRAIRISDVEIRLYSLVAVSLLSAVAIAIGRVGFHQIEWAIASRYRTIVSVGIGALYLLLIKDRRPSEPPRPGVPWPSPSLLSGLLTALILVGSVAAVPWAFHIGAGLRDSRTRLRHAIQMFPVSADAMFDSAGPGVAPTIREHAPLLQAKAWSVFRGPIPALLLPSTRHGVPAGEIVAGRPVVQHLRCPVETLTEIGILFATYGRQNTSTVSVHLSAGERTLVDRSFPAAQVEDNQWWTVALSPPLRTCAGRALTLTVASTDARPGNAITIWTYPRYYPGTLTSPAALPSARVLGISLNASPYR